MSHYLEPDLLLAKLVSDLEPWVREQKGLLSVAADPWHFLELLAEAPQGWRAVLHFSGDDNRMDDPDAGCWCNYRFEVGVTCQKGLSLDPEEGLYKPRPGHAPALLRLVALTRQRIRSLEFVVEGSPRHVLYRGREPIVLPDGTPLSGYRLRFELIAHPEPIEAYRQI